MTYIYLVENCYNDPKKVYIGKTKNIVGKNRRSLSHIRKYGKNSSFTIIDQIDSFDRKYWKPLETYWIWQFKTWGFNILNKNNGGSGPTYLTNESKLKISKKKKGHKCYNKQWRNKIKKGWTNERKKELSIKKLGTKQSEETKRKRSEKLIGIKQSKETCLKKSLKTKNKPKPIGFGILISLKNKGLKHGKPKKSIIQYNPNGKIVKEWESISEAVKILKIKSIHDCLSGRQKQSGGYIWKYK